MLDAGRHPNIDLLAYSEVEKVEGQSGDFKVQIRRKARYVEEDKCTGCGACKEKCPTVVPDAFNEGLGERRAIYSWFAQGIPSTHTIDPDHCQQLNGKNVVSVQRSARPMPSILTSRTVLSISGSAPLLLPPVMTYLIRLKYRNINTNRFQTS